MTDTINMMIDPTIKCAPYDWSSGRRVSHDGDVFIFQSSNEANNIQQLSNIQFFFAYLEKDEVNLVVWISSDFLALHLDIFG